MSIILSNPYIGPRPFKKEEAQRFFGREREARELLALVSSQRLVLFYASSGAGKSSLINARLIDALEGREFEVLPIGRVSGVLPREAGIDLSGINIFSYFLKQSLVEHRLDATLTTAGQQFFREYADASLSEFLLRLAPAGKDEAGNNRYIFTTPGAAVDITPPPLAETAEVELRPRALIIDQFEEIFTTNLQAWQQRNDFFSQIHRAMEDDPYLWVVLAMREDFIANLDPYAHLLPGELHARYYMQRMGYAAALDAVRKPVEIEDPDHPEWQRPFAPGVAEKLVDNLRQVHITAEEGEGVASATGEFVEPVQLQVVCYQLWEQLRDTPGTEITAQDLDRLAGGQDLSVFVDRALSDFYEQAIRRVLDQAGSLVSETELRRWFSERLITESGTRGFVYRGETETGGLPNEVVRLIAREFLIRSESRAGGTWYELSHDRFVEPIQRSNQLWSLEQLQRNPLLRRAHEWAASHADPAQRDAAILLTDDELKNLDISGQALEPVVHDFLEASQRAKEQRDLVAAQRQLEEAGQREQAEKRISRRFRALAALAAIMAVSAFIAWVVVFGQARELRVTNDDLVEAKAISDANADAAATSAAGEKAAKEGEIAARLEAQSQSLANQALDLTNRIGEGQIDNTGLETALLFSEEATTISRTLLAESAMLAALTLSYQGPNSQGQTVPVPVFVPDPLALPGKDGLERLAISSDGRYMVIGDSAGGLQVWDTAQHRPAGERLAAHGLSPVFGLAFDPTRLRFASASGDPNDPSKRQHRLLLWDLSGGAAISRTLAMDSGSVGSLAFSPNGQMLAAGLYDGRVVLWEDLSATRPVSRTLPGSRGSWVWAVDFDSTGERLVTGNQDGSIVIWSDLAASQPLSQTLAAHAGTVNDVAFSPDGAQMVSISGDGSVRLWNLTSDPPTYQPLEMQSGIEGFSAAFSPDGRRLATGWRNGAVLVQQLGSTSTMSLTLSTNAGAVKGLAFDPRDSQKLFSASSQEPFALAWDLSQRYEFASVQPITPTLPITSALAAASADGRWLAAADRKGTVIVVDLAGGGRPVTVTVGMPGLQALALNTDGRLLAMAGCELPPPPKPTSPPTSQPTPTASATPSAPGANATTTPTSTPTPTVVPSTCHLRLWDLALDPPRVRWELSRGVKPIKALTFHPLTAKLASASQDGEILLWATEGIGRSPAPQRWQDRITRPVDLAFSSDGTLLAGLDDSGLVKVWPWASHGASTVISGRPGTAKDNPTYSAIAFAHGADWLALAANSSSQGTQLTLWSRSVTNFEPVGTAFVMGQDPALDVIFSPDSQMLAAIQPRQIYRWDLDAQQWPELACRRAGRNLTFEEWSKAFPGRDDPDTYQNDLTCGQYGYRLHSTFVTDKIDEARDLVQDCTASGVLRGMQLLEDARKLPVDPPIALDPLNETIGILTDQASQYVQEDNSDRAKECLLQANVRLTAARQPAFDVDQALAIRRNLAQAQQALAGSTTAPQAEASQAMANLQWVDANRAQWPGDLSRELSAAYYAACINATDNAACERFAALGNTLQYGDAVVGVHKSGVEEPLYFLGKRGDAVTIAMNAVANAFDTKVRLEGPDGILTEDDDSGPDNNSLIANYLLPKDTIYRIIPTAYLGEGSYRLSLDARNPRPIAQGAREVSTTADDNLWQFTGRAGQLIAIAMEDTDGNYDPSLRLIGPDLTTLKEDYDSGGNLNALIVATLPADGPYFVRTEPVGSNVPYTLHLFEPRPLPFDEPQASSTLTDTLWMFDSDRSRVIDLAVTPAGSGLEPQLTLRSASGDKLAEGVSSSEDRTTRVSAQILPANGRFIVQVGPSGSRTPYTLTMTSVITQSLNLGQPATSTTQAHPIWTFTGTSGQIVDIALNSSNPPLFDPTLSLLDASGRAIASDSDSGGNLNARIPAFFLPADGQYFVRPLPANRTVTYTLTVAEVSPRAIEPGNTETSSLRQDTLWAFDGVAGQPIDVLLQSEIGDIAAVALLSGTGQTLRAPDSSRIDGYILPKTGRYYLRVGGNLNQDTNYDLALSETPTRAIQPGEVFTSTTEVDTLWTVEASAGQVFDITMNAVAPESGLLNPYLTVHGPDGASLASDDDSGGYPNARISSFIVPKTGRYIVRAGPLGSDAEYAIAVKQVEAPEIKLSETRMSNTKTDELWWFAGQAGQVVDIDMSGWVSGGFDPYLTLLGPDGSRLIENDDISGADYNARIAGFVLPQTGNYFIRAGRPGGTTRYQLKVTPHGATPTVLGSVIQVTQNSAFGLQIERPTLVQITTDEPAALTLVGPGGTALISRAEAILGRLSASGAYTVSVSMPSGSAPRTLSIKPVPGAQRRLNMPSESRSELRPGATEVWMFPDGGATGAVIAVDAAGTAPQLTLYAPSGELIRESNRDGVLTSPLPMPGNYLLTVHAPDAQASGAYTLTVQPASVAFGPQACSFSSSTADFDPVRQGSMVVLGRHRPVNGDPAWDSAMMAFVGQQARVTSLAGYDGQGCPIVYVDVDQGRFSWRVRDLVVMR